MTFRQDEHDPWFRTAVGVGRVAVLLAILVPVTVASAIPSPEGAHDSLPQDGLIRVFNPAGVRADGVFVDELLARSLRELGRRKPPEAAQFPQTQVETVTADGDPFDAINDLFYRRGWTDGLPIVPPTVERVTEMLQGSDLSPGFVVSTVDPMQGRATVEKIAVNAVMAGARPVDMPVLIAAVEALGDPALNLRGIATTTNPDTPMLILSGPMVQQLGVNAGVNALGRGWRANAAIGRALHLIVQNVGGSWPGVTDLSCLGHPGDFTMVLAENEAASPWPPFHMELGFPKRANVVTVVGAEGTHNILGIGQSPEGYLKLIASNLAGMDRPYRSLVVLVVAQDTAAHLARAGWDRAKMRRFIHENAWLPFAAYKERFLDTGVARPGGPVPGWVFEVADPDTRIPTPLIDQLLILVAGGPGEKSTIVPGWVGAHAVSREVRLPWNWNDLVARYVPAFDR